MVWYDYHMDTEALERKRARSREWYQRDREANKQRMREWQAANPDAMKTIYARAYQKKRGTLRGYFNSKLSTTRATCRKRKLCFELDVDWAEAQVVAQDGKCARTGIDFRLGGPKQDPYAPSFDQIIPNTGYTKDNTQIVCRMYNAAKYVWTDDEVLEMAQALIATKSPPDTNALI